MDGEAAVDSEPAVAAEAGVAGEDDVEGDAAGGEDVAVDVGVAGIAAGAGGAVAGAGGAARGAAGSGAPVCAVDDAHGHAAVTTASTATTEPRETARRTLRRKMEIGSVRSGRSNEGSAAIMMSGNQPVAMLPIRIVGAA